MCRRFALTLPADDVQPEMGVIDMGDFPPRYNIAPTQPIAMVLAGHPRDRGSNLPERRSMLVRWGFIPSWAKNSQKLPLWINARSETAAEKNTFKAALRHRRALIPASGFYEWKRENGKTGQAWWIRPKRGGLIAFAGLMETFGEPGGSEIDTGAILTIAANGAIATIHDRVPVIIPPEHFARWLDCRRLEPRDVADLFRPAEPDFFELIPVSDMVNNVANMGPDIQEREEPVEPSQKPKQNSGQLSLF